MKELTQRWSCYKDNLGNGALIDAVCSLLIGVGVIGRVEGERHARHIATAHAFHDVLTRWGVWELKQHLYAETVLGERERAGAVCMMAGEQFLAVVESRTDDVGSVEHLLVDGFWQDILAVNLILPPVEHNDRWLIKNNGIALKLGSLAAVIAGNLAKNGLLDLSK